MPANSRWDLIQRLKGFKILQGIFDPLSEAYA